MSWSRRHGHPEEKGPHGFEGGEDQECMVTFVDTEFYRNCSEKAIV